VTFHSVESTGSTASGLRFRTNVIAPHAATPAHSHAHPYFCVVLDGASVQTSGGAEWRRDRGRAYFYPAAEVQSEQFGATGGRIFSADLVEFGLALPRLSCELLGSAALLARRAYAEHSDPLGFEETVLSLVGMLARESCAARAWGSIVREYLREHFAEKLSLRAVALAAGVHPVHLSRAFPQRFGMTLGEYVRALRVDYAARELVATRRPIADIALDAGFASQAHLTRHFRARMGVAPAAYRAAC
jgi:AraC family transcriptional regulator